MPEERPGVEDRIIAQLSRMDEKMEARFESLEREIQTFKEDVGQKFAQTGERLSRLEGGFEQMDKRMADLGAHVDKRLGGMDQRIADLNGRLSSVESLQRWAIGLIITSWFTLVGLIIAMMFRMT